MNPNSTRQKLWDILGKPERKRIGLDPLLESKRILPATGSYSYEQELGGGNNDGSEENSEQDPDKEPEKDPKKKKNPNDPRRLPHECPNEGEQVVGLTGMHDCQTGRAVNVNFTIPAPEPDDWGEEEVLGAKIFKVSLGIVDTVITEKNIIDTKGVMSRDFCFTNQEKMISFLSNLLKNYTFYGKSPRESAMIQLAGRKEYPDIDRVFHTSSAAKTNGIIDNYYGYSPSNVFSNLRVHDVSKWSKKQIQDYLQECKAEIWPDQLPTEIVATSYGFQAAYPDQDLNTPEQLKTETTAIRLCDDLGNVIDIERYGKGFRYRNGHCEVTVSDSGKVTSVRPV